MKKHKKEISISKDKLFLRDRGIFNYTFPLNANGNSLRTSVKFRERYQDGRIKFKGFLKQVDIKNPKKSYNLINDFYNKAIKEGKSDIPNISYSQFKREILNMTEFEETEDIKGAYEYLMLNFIKNSYQKNKAEFERFRSYPNHNDPPNCNDKDSFYYKYQEDLCEYLIVLQNAIDIMNKEVNGINTNCAYTKITLGLFDNPVDNDIKESINSNFLNYQTILSSMAGSGSSYVLQDDNTQISPTDNSISYWNDDFNPYLRRYSSSKERLMKCKTLNDFNKLPQNDKEILATRAHMSLSHYQNLSTYKGTDVIWTGREYGNNARNYESSYDIRILDVHENEDGNNYVYNDKSLNTYEQAYNSSILTSEGSLRKEQQYLYYFNCKGSYSTGVDFAGNIDPIFSDSLRIFRSKELLTAYEHFCKELRKAKKSRVLNNVPYLSYGMARFFTFIDNKNTTLGEDIIKTQYARGKCYITENWYKEELKDYEKFRGNLFLGISGKDFRNSYVLIKNKKIRKRKDCLSDKVNNIESLFDVTKWYIENLKESPFEYKGFKSLSLNLGGGLHFSNILNSLHFTYGVNRPKLIDENLGIHCNQFLSLSSPIMDYDNPISSVNTLYFYNTYKYHKDTKELLFKDFYKKDINNLVSLGLTTDQIALHPFIKGTSEKEVETIKTLHKLILTKEVDWYSTKHQNSYNIDTNLLYKWTYLLRSPKLVSREYYFSNIKPQEEFFFRSGRSMYIDYLSCLCKSFEVPKDSTEEVFARQKEQNCTLIARALNWRDKDNSGYSYWLDEYYGDKDFIKDNVSTIFDIDGKHYYATNTHKTGSLFPSLISREDNLRYKEIYEKIDLSNAYYSSTTVTNILRSSIGSAEERKLITGFAYNSSRTPVMFSWNAQTAFRVSVVYFDSNFDFRKTLTPDVIGETFHSRCLSIYGDNDVSHLQSTKRYLLVQKYFSSMASNSVLIYSSIGSYSIVASTDAIYAYINDRLEAGYILEDGHHDRYRDFAWTCEDYDTPATIDSDYLRDNGWICDDEGVWYTEEDYYDRYGDDDYDRDEDRSKVAGYHSYCPRPCEFDPDKAVATYGIEVEKEDYDARDSENHYDIFRRCKLMKERDSSLCEESGYEIITPTFDLYRHDFKEWVNKNEIKYLYNAERNETCGMHFHIGRVGMNGLSYYDRIKYYIPLLYALYEARVNNSYSTAQSIDNMKEKRERTQAVNIMNNRIEIRIFPSPKNLKTVLWRIDLVKIMDQKPLNSVDELIRDVLDERTRLYKHLRKIYNKEQLSQRLVRAVHYVHRFEDANWNVNKVIPKKKMRDYGLNLEEIASAASYTNSEARDRDSLGFDETTTD